MFFVFSRRRRGEYKDYLKLVVFWRKFCFFVFPRRRRGKYKDQLILVVFGGLL